MSFGKPKECEVCGNDIDQSGRGRPRKTCSGECAQIAHRRTKGHDPAAGTIVEHVVRR